MDYDLDELIAIRENPNYIQYIEVSKREAKNAKLRKETRPKIVNANMIEFYGSERGGNGDTHGKWFSNCTYSKFTIANSTYISSEHYFQRAKFIINENDPEVLLWCREHRKPVQDQIKCNELVREQMATMTPVKVAQFGQTMRSAPIRGDWDIVRNQVMWDGLVAKFTQNAEYKKALVDTADAVLIERAPTDKYWAINNTGQGDNTLGVMLMALRNLLDE